jgi:protein-disulfide isomerase
VPAASAQSAADASLAPVAIVDGKQVVAMRVSGFTYEPHIFNVVAGMPVEWRIDGRDAAGCGRFLIAPRAGIRKILSSHDTTVITFTPPEAGEIGFNCRMRMMTRGSKFIVRASAAAAPTATPPKLDAPAVSPLRAPPAPSTKPDIAAPVSPGQRAEVERITKEYLLEHPEVIAAALQALDKRQQAAQAEQHHNAIKDNAGTLFNSPRQVVLGNPQGETTLVEFFDYNCPYCKRSLDDVLALLSSEPRLRLVLKEYPILGEASTDAESVAIAAHMQDAGGAKYLEFHKKLLGGHERADKARALAAAAEAGFDMERLHRDLASPEVNATIAENLKLGEALGIDGTPTFVIGNDLVVGAVGLEALKEKLRAARL